MTLTIKHDLEIVTMNHYLNYVGQRSLCSKVIVWAVKLVLSSFLLYCTHVRMSYV